MELSLPFSTFMDEKEMCAKQFHSWESFSSFFDEWCEQRNAIFCKRSAIPLTKCRWDSQMTPEAMAALKYRHVTLICKNGAHPRNPVNRAQKDLCQASVHLRLNEKKDKLIISKCLLTHNHELCPQEFARCFRKGYMMANSCLRITNKMSKQFLAMEDIQRLVSTCQTEENWVLDVLNAMESLFVHDLGAKVKMLFVEDQPAVRTVFFITSLMRSLCQRFPEMLVFDRMVCLDEEFDLYVLLCVDSNGQGQECAYCLTHKGTPNLLRFTLESLVQSVPEVKQKVRCMTVGLEILDQKAVEKLLPNAQVQIGRSQEMLFSKAQEMGAPEDKKIWTLLGELVSASCLKAYTRTVKKMETIFPKNFMDYFQEHWHSCRKMWVDFWAFKATHDISASELIRRHQQQLVSNISPSPTLARGILDLVALQTAKAKDLNDEEVAVMYQSFYSAEQVNLIKQELVFARKGTYNVQGTTEGFSINDGKSEFFMNQKLTFCNCSISTFSFLPCRHLFTTRIRTGEALFDGGLLQKKKCTQTFGDRCEFLSWNEFVDFFDEWSEKNCVLYQMKSYTTIFKGKSSQPINADIRSQLRYSYVRLVCKNAIAAQCSKKTSLMETCPSNIVLRAGPDCDRLIIEQAVLEHNHENTEEEFFTHYQRCRLKAKPYFLLEVTNSISKQFLMASELQKLLERSCDVEPVLQDLLREISALFLADSKVKVKLVFYPDEVAVESIFLMTSRMRRLLQRFPSILFLDRSLSVNKNFDLYTMLCEDADGSGRECAYFLAHKESQTPVRFMVVSLMQSIPYIVKSQIKTVVLNTDFAELDLIRALLPKRTVVMSQAHALEALYSLVDQENPSVHETLKNIIQRLVFSQTPEAFKCHMKELEPVPLSGFLAYFLEIWFPRKEMWVACWGLKKPERSRFLELVLCHQLALRSALSPPMTLAGCVRGLMRLQSLKVLTSMLNEEKLSALYQSVCPPGSLKLVQEEISLTKQGCYEVTEVEGGFSLNDGISNFRIDKDMACCSCSIYTSSLLPCRHLFAARLWAGEPVFDLKLVQGH